MDEILILSGIRLIQRLKFSCKLKDYTDADDLDHKRKYSIFRKKIQFGKLNNLENYIYNSENCIREGFQSLPYIWLRKKKRKT